LLREAAHREREAVGLFLDMGGGHVVSISRPWYKEQGKANFGTNNE
jgi:hypothetical protein